MLGIDLKRQCAFKRGVDYLYMLGSISSYIFISSCVQFRCSASLESTLEGVVDIFELFPSSAPVASSKLKCPDSPCLHLKLLIIPNVPANEEDLAAISSFLAIFMDAIGKCWISKRVFSTTWGSLLNFNTPFLMWVLRTFMKRVSFARAWPKLSDATLFCSKNSA